MLRPSDSNFVGILCRLYITKSLADKCPQWPAVSASCLQLMQDGMKYDKVKLSPEVAKAAVDWLSRSTEMVSDRVASLPRAILDSNKKEERAKAACPEGSASSVQSEFDDLS